MGAGGATQIGIGIGGAIGGAKAAQRTKRGSDSALDRGSYESAYDQLEGILLSYDDLVGMGRIGTQVADSEAARRINEGWTFGGRKKVDPQSRAWVAGSSNGPPSYYGLSGNQSRMSRALGAYEQSLIEGSDVFRASRDMLMEGLTSTDGIPDDMRRSITEELRQAQASRGIVDSNVAATEEVVRLMGGQEQVRAQRLSQAQDYFTSVLGSALGNIAPNVNTIYGSELQRSIERAKGRREAAKVGADIYGSSV